MTPVFWPGFKSGLLAKVEEVKRADLQEDSAWQCLQETSQRDTRSGAVMRMPLMQVSFETYQKWDGNESTEHE